MASMLRLTNDQSFCSLFCRMCVCCCLVVYDNETAYLVYLSVLIFMHQLMQSGEERGPSTLCNLNFSSLKGLDCVSE